MTEAQILQQNLLYEFFSRISQGNILAAYTDAELMRLYRAAVDEQDGRKIKAIHAEMSRRNREV